MLLQKIQELATQNDNSEERFSTHVFSQTRSVFLGGFENDTFLLSQDGVRFRLAEPHCQFHTQHVSLQCLSTEITHLSQTTFR